MRSGTSHSSLDLAGLQSVSTLSICNLHLIRAAFHLSYLHTHTHTHTLPPTLPHTHILLYYLHPPLSPSPANSPIPLPLPPLHSHLPRPQRLRQPPRDTPTTVPRPRLAHPAPAVPAIPTVRRRFARRRALGRGRGGFGFPVGGTRGRRRWCCVRLQVRAGRPAGGGFVEAGG